MALVGTDKDMSFYIGREASKVCFFKTFACGICLILFFFSGDPFSLIVMVCCYGEQLWKRFCAEVTTEINLLAENWKYLLGGLICQVSIYLYLLSFDQLFFFFWFCVYLGLLDYMDLWYFMSLGI